MSAADALSPVRNLRPDSFSLRAPRVVRSFIALPWTSCMLLVPLKESSVIVQKQGRADIVSEQQRARLAGTCVAPPFFFGRGRGNICPSHRAPVTSHSLTIKRTCIVECERPVMGPSMATKTKSETPSPVLRWCQLR